MPPLDNPRHEAFVQNLVKPGAPSYLNLKKSYQSTYPNTNESSATANGSRLIRDDNVNSRFLELMEKQGLTDDKFNQVHADLLANEDGNLRFKALRLGHELKGRLSQSRNDPASSLAAVQVTINIANKAP